MSTGNAATDRQQDAARFFDSLFSAHHETVLRYAASGCAQPFSLFAAALQIPTIQDAILGTSLMTGPEKVLAIVWYLPMIALETWGFSICFAPRSDHAPDPTLVKRVIFTIPTVVMVSFSALALGVAEM